MISTSFIKIDEIKKSFPLLYIHTALFSISRFLLGLSNERIITRKYVILFIPESKMRYFSIYFLLTSYLGLIIGACLNFFIEKLPKILIFENEDLLYIIGAIISVILLLIILILFTEPNKNDEANMLTQQILSISQVTDDFEEEDPNQKKDKKDERYQISESESSGVKSINDQSRNNLGDLIFQENNKEIKIYDSELDIESLKSQDKKVVTKEELQGLNSIEKDIILMNQSNNFDDVNLLGNELEKIKRNQINNNKVFRKSFIVFVLTLFLCNMINEYILIKTPFILEELQLDKSDKSDNNLQKLVVTSSFILLLIFSFPLIVFCRIIKKFDIERRLLLIIYILVLFILVGIGLYKYSEFGQKKPLLLIIFLTFLLNNCLDGITHLLIEKIIPSFAKICGINMKYLFSYSIHIGKAFGGINFFFIFFFFYQQDKKILDNFESIFYIGITLIFFIISFIFYQSLRVRAFTKLRY